MAKIPQDLRYTKDHEWIRMEGAMGVMGITREELIDVDEVAGVATFIARAKESGPTLFI